MPLQETNKQTLKTSKVHLNLRTTLFSLLSTCSKIVLHMEDLAIIAALNHKGFFWKAFCYVLEEN